MQIYALCIGIDDYGNQISIPDLNHAVNDACEVRRVLSEHYGAKTWLLCSKSKKSANGRKLLSGIESNGSGTRKQILEIIHRTRHYITSEDIFIFFFAGHSVPDEPGYLVPYSAESGRKSNYLMYKTLFASIATLPCNYVMLFLDCCYAGMTGGTIASMPGLILSRKRAVLYAATEDATIALDGLPVGKDGCNSFTHTLVQFLEYETKPGCSFYPEALAAYFIKNVTANLRQNSGMVHAMPVFHSSIDAIGSGKFYFEIFRPGFSVHIKSANFCETGETLSLEVDVRGNNSPNVKLSVEPKLVGFKPALMELQGRELMCRFDYPGTFLFNVVATDSETGERAFRTFTIDVEHGEIKPVSLVDRPLEICRRGERYSSSLTIVGGTPPFRLSVYGLPSGIQATIEGNNRICLSGTLPASDSGGTPLSSDNGPVVFNLDIRLKDRTGKRYRKLQRLIVYNPDDYCCIPSSTYSVGLKRNLRTITAICNVFHSRLAEFAKDLKLKKRDLEDLLNQLSNDLAEETLNKILSTAPHAVVQVRKFLIKKYPITLCDWKRFLYDTNAPHIPAYRWPPEDKDLKKPVTGISYEAVCAYLKWKGTRLPTGREWQIAADGGSDKLFPWGDRFEPQKCNMKGSLPEMNLIDVDVYDDTYESRTGTKDMVGNAAEWVDRRVYWDRRKSFAQVFRGGSFRDFPMYGITSCDSRETGVLYATDERKGKIGETRFDWLGFRDVIELDLPPDLLQGIIDLSLIHI